MTSCRVRGLQLACEMTGDGPALVLLHGFTGRGADWLPFVPSWAQRFRVIVVDLPGHGDSDAPADPERYRMEECVADLRVLLEQLGVPRATWLGYSMGGRVALGAAVLAPDLVERLILEGASPGLAGEEERQARVVHDEAWARRLEEEGIDAFVEAWMAQALFASRRRLGSAALVANAAMRRRSRVEGLAGSLRGLGTGRQPSLWERLPEVRVPTLLVVGEEDGKFTRVAYEMAKRLPEARVVVVPGAGHTVHLENPAGFAAAVEEFLNSAESRPSGSPIP